MKFSTMVILALGGYAAYSIYKARQAAQLAPGTPSGVVPLPTDTMAPGTMPGAANGILQYAGNLVSLPGGMPITGQPAIPGSPEPASGTDSMGPVIVPHHEAVPGTSFQWMNNGFHIVPVRAGVVSKQGVESSQLDKFMPPLVYFNGQPVDHPKGQQLIDMGVAMGVLEPKGKGYVFPFSKYKPTTAWPKDKAIIHAKKHLIVMANKA